MNTSTIMTESKPRIADPDPSIEYTVSIDREWANNVLTHIAITLMGWSDEANGRAESVRHRRRRAPQHSEDVRAGGAPALPPLRRRARVHQLVDDEGVLPELQPALRGAGGGGPTSSGR